MVYAVADLYCSGGAARGGGGSGGLAGTCSTALCAARALGEQGGHKRRGDGLAPKLMRGQAIAKSRCLAHVPAPTAQSAAFDAFDRQNEYVTASASQNKRRAYLAPWYVTTTADTRARHPIRTVDGASWFAAKRRLSASAGRPQLFAFAKAAARPPARRAHAAARAHRKTHTAASSRKIPDSCARRDRSRRTGGPTDA